jgi:glycosyltransferase involved in cell wall biosynthesis
MKLSVVLIVKNESSCLERCLESVKDLGELVIVDTGSTDNTKEIAKKYTDKVHDFEWNDRFDDARNFALSKATGDWLLSIDADEELISLPVHFEGKAMDVTLVSGTHVHKTPRLFKKGAKWVGAVHEVINVPSSGDSGAVIRYGYSEAHKSDPERNLRILLKALKEGDTSPRTLFYIGRESFERKQYEVAVTYLEMYLLKATWIPEKAEAYLTLARCYWQLGEGDKAREACLRAIEVNPMFKEALLFMSEMHYEPWKKGWLTLSEKADNSNVLFVRT